MSGTFRRQPRPGTSVLFVLATLGIDPERFIGAVGTMGVFAAGFAESGTMVGFFLPGDSLRFTAGLLSATGRLPALPILLVGCFLTAVAGDQVGYLFGRRVGPSLFRRPDSRTAGRGAPSPAELIRPRPPPYSAV